MTIILSFLLFPKPVSIYYLYGGILVFGGLIGNVLLKEKYYSNSKDRNIV